MALRATDRVPNRIPPHNLDAEESVLGAMLESRDAISAVVEILRPEDFYKPAHARVYEVICDIYARSQPADAITVAEELGRRGLLDQIGGKPYIHGLLEAYPTASSAAHYARIVDEHATLRRLVEAGNKVQELGFSIPEDVGEAVDDAEQTIYEVGDRRLRSELQQIKPLLSQTMENLEVLMNGQGTTGLASGFGDLDDKTLGFQPTQLVIVAARPSMGKCLAAESLIDDPATGDRVTIRDYVERKVERVSGIDHKARLRTTEIGDWVPNGRKECFRLTTRSGRRIDLTDNHPLMTAEGWVPLADLSPGDRIAVPHRLPIFGDGAGWTAERARVLGRRVGESDEKLFPAPVWRFTRKQLREFLQAFFSCRGTLNPIGDHARIGLTSASQQLAEDVQHALLRFGIVSKLWQKTDRSWRVEITQPASVDRYQIEIGWIGEKARRGFWTAQHRRSNNGHLPPSAWRFVKKACANAGISLSELARRSGEAQNLHTKRGLPRVRLERYAAILDDDDLRFLSSPDLYWDEITSIESVGEHNVYDIEVPDGNNFVAQDVCVHNSSLLGDFALNAAVRLHQPVIMFSLEMSSSELTQRFLASEARVDSQKMRRGTLAEQDWTKMSAALGRLSEAPLYIDDSANITLMEMRAKCRRLKARQGLGLVIIDYLQLMQSPRRSENRQQEVSEISRGLKILAKELEVPVMCASQLNRAVETRHDKRPFLGDLRESGCLTGESRVSLADGRLVEIRDLVGKEPIVVTLDGWKLGSERAIKVWKSGRKPVFKLRTRSGRELRATGNHPFLLLEGWMPLEGLRPGDRICTARTHAGRQLVSAAAGAHSNVGFKSLLQNDFAPTLGAHDLFWDEVVSIEPDGIEDVYDMTVSGTHNFVANGIVTHNSIEQDADLVMFIYRDEVYNPDSDARGEAELIIAKHRNGPTGTVRLAFMNQYTKFASIAKGI